MDLEAAFIGSLIKGGRPAIIHAKELQIKPADLESDAQDALSFLYSYVSDHEGAPDSDIVTLKTGMVPEVTPGSADFFSQEIISKKLFLVLQKGLSEMSSLMSSGKPRESLAFMEKLLRDTRDSVQIGSPVSSLFDSGDDVKKDYDDMKAGVRGILTRWPTINDRVLGWFPEDLVLFVARVSVGKSWSSILMAHDAWDLTIPSGPKRGMKQNKRVLYVTTEMARKRIAGRFYAVRMRLPYAMFREGRLGPIYEEKMREGIDSLAGADGFYVVGGDFDYTIEGLEAAIEKVEPDIIFLDGAYLLKGNGANRTERAANTFDDLKRMAKRYQRPVVITSQMNRQSKAGQKDTVTSENIALSDTASWNSDVVVGMVQSPDMKIDNRMIFIPIKVREGSLPEIELNWNYDTMNFSEVPKTPGGNPLTLVKGDASDGDGDDSPF